MTVVVNLGKVLVSKGITQGMLAKNTGITEANISKLVQGKVKGVRFSTLEKLSEYLDVPLGAILTIE